MLRRREDGYHDLDTLFQSISLSDLVDLEESREVSIECDDPEIPTDRRNLVYRAAELMSQQFGAPPVRVRLTKRIPAGGGLGGGSSNAAATLRALDRMFALKVPPAQLATAALQLGSDVPFFLVGGAAIGKGRGEELTPLPDPPRTELLLLLPDERVATPSAFQALAALREKRAVDIGSAGSADVTANIAAELAANAGQLVNDLEEPVFAMLPRLGELKAALRERGAVWSGMSGSGSTIVGMFASAEERDAAQAALAAQVRAVAAHTITREQALRL